MLFKSVVVFFTCIILSCVSIPCAIAQVTGQVSSPRQSIEENSDISNARGVGFSVHLLFDGVQPFIDYAFLLEPNQVSSMHVFGLRLNL